MESHDEESDNDLLGDVPELNPLEYFEDEADDGGDGGIEGKVFDFIFLKISLWF